MQSPLSHPIPKTISIYSHSHYRADLSLKPPFNPTLRATQASNQCYTQGAFARQARPPELFRIKAHDNFGGCTIALDKRSAKSFIRINDRIRAREIRVIDENGEQLGILAPF